MNLTDTVITNPLNEGQRQYTAYILRRLAAEGDRKYAAPPVNYATFIQMMNDRDAYLKSGTQEEIERNVSLVEAIDTLLYITDNQSLGRFENAGSPSQPEDYLFGES